MANVILPEQFENLLKKDQRLSGVVYSTLSDFGEILKENKLYFFEEYTEHGISHIQSVLRGSERLIKKETIESIFQVQDVAYYILAVLLHDIGMHLNYDGFLSLLNGDNDDINVKELDELKWIDLWQEYLAEAKRFNGKQLYAIFGDENTIIHDPFNKKRGDLTSNDRKLIGEFIRRNHPRLAHEIALKGMPGTNRLAFGGDLEYNIKNLIGLVARSHGMDLRKCLDYLVETYGKETRRNAYGTHWVFLMILLRIADYLQIDKDRSSSIILKTKTFESPISNIEHSAHEIVNNIDDKFQDDPEMIFVTISPKDSYMHLKLKRLIKSIQYEFDLSWAVLGELYGNIKEKPEIKYRRITSNLESKDFENKQNYIPEQFSFKANDDIIKLLISPLYGKDPKYGVRELLQNSVDACHERNECEKSNKKYVPVIAIKVYQENNEPYFEIMDNGKGMSIDEIKNYFLKAGASYRTSLDWKKQFIDENGKSKIQRNGRFGVGALAAFLLGNEIYVETRKMNSQIGFVFKASLNSDQINITKSDKLKEGTIIRIKTNEQIIELLEKELKRPSYYHDVRWHEWYTLAIPEIKYKFFGQELIPYKSLDPYYTNVPKDWNFIDSDGFEKILWRYKKHSYEKELICNGIVIPENSYEQEKHFDLGLIRSKPKLVIFDNDGVLPISLNRNKLTDKVSFSQDLKIDLYKDFIARILTFDLKANVKDNKITIGVQHFNYPGNIRNDSIYNRYGPSNYYLPIELEKNYLEQYYYNQNLIDQFLISKNGYIVNYNYFIKHLTKPNLLFIQAENINKEHLTIDIEDNFFMFSNSKINSIEDYKSAIEGNFHNLKSNSMEKNDTRIFLKTEKYNHLFRSSVKRVSNYLKSHCKIDGEFKGWMKIKLDNPKDSLITDKFLLSHKDDINFIRESPLYCFGAGDKDFNDLLEKYIGKDIVIPYSLKKRREKYPLVFKELESYMKKYL
ncbi:MAG TPA: ATP-binding protein [Bacteroidia bacterium]|nr:ATP-binding protein [Bacteroidia bacterium]